MIKGSSQFPNIRAKKFLLIIENNYIINTMKT